MSETKDIIDVKTTDIMQNTALDDVNDIKQVEKSSDITVIPTKKKRPKTLNARERNFCLYIDKGMKGSEAVKLAGYKPANDTVASNMSREILDRPYVKCELERLYNLRCSNLNNTDFMSGVNALHDKALKKVGELIDTDGFVGLAAAKEILARTVPIKTVHESRKMVLTKTEITRRQKLLEEP